MMIGWIDFLNSREKATAFWLIVILAYACSKNGRAIGKSFLGVGRAAAAWQIAVPVLAAAGYTVGVVCIASRLGLWEPALIKETTYWFIGTALIFIGDAMGSPDGRHYVRRVVARTLRLAVFVDFFVGLYVLPLAVELLVVPIALLFVAMQAVAANNANYDDRTRSFINGVLGLIGWGLFAWTIASVTSNPHQFASQATAERLLTPIELSFALLPVLVTLRAWSAWELGRVRARARYN